MASLLGENDEIHKIKKAPNIRSEFKVFLKSIKFHYLNKIIKGNERKNQTRS